MEIVPAVDTKFAKSDELQTFLLIYNAKTDKDNKPDISVEFNFYTKQAGAEKFFNKTNPQNLNAPDPAARRSISRPATSSRPVRPCRWPRSRKVNTGWKSRSRTSWPTSR